MDRTPTVTRHPIRGALYGLLLGFSVAVYLILFAVIAFGDWVPLIIVVVAGMVVGIAWALLAPPKRPKGAPDRAPEGRSVPEYGGVEQVTVGPYTPPAPGAPTQTSAPTAAPMAAEPPAPQPPAAEPGEPSEASGAWTDDDSGEFDADV